MIYLLGSILSSTLIYIVFKLFSVYKINTLQAIVVNYLVAASAGILSYGGPVDFAGLTASGWFPGALLLGILFILIFNLMAITAQRSGLSVVSVATKMSVAIPILFGILYYGESLGPLKLLGIILALVAVYLASVKKSDGLPVQKAVFIFPLLVFLGSGIIDTSIKFLEDAYVAKTDVALFSSVIFVTAFGVGLIIIIYQLLRGTFTFSIKNLLGGVALGIPNYFSIYFLVLALRSGLASSTVFVLNNVSIVILSTLLGIVLFGEKLLTKNWIGIVLATVGIILISLSL